MRPGCFLTECPRSYGSGASAVGSVPVRRQRAARRVNREHGDVMLGPSRAVTRSAAAGRNVQITSGGMRPGILDTSGQRDRATLDQLSARDIDVVVGQFGS